MATTQTRLFITCCNEVELKSGGHRVAAIISTKLAQPSPNSRSGNGSSDASAPNIDNLCDSTYDYARFIRQVRTDPA